MIADSPRHPPPSNIGKRYVLSFGIINPFRRSQLRLCHNALEMTELYLRPGVKFVAKVSHWVIRKFRAELKRQHAHEQKLEIELDTGSLSVGDV
uniref:Uncharacterized protein n=1 Tax=Hyaloperonospora arabidopsidis (strain Emoy2) TaxID=559515 RepID=M4BUP0_HYAAE